MSNSSALEITKKLVAFDSVCPDNSKAQDFIADFLSQRGFSISHLDTVGSRNLWARRGSSGPLIVFAGHSDVVPPGDLTKWSAAPFEPTVREGKLYGRGVADMKGGVGAFLAAVDRFISENKEDSKISIGLMIAGDEEGPSRGTPALLDLIHKRGERIDYCIVGEPTCSEVFGDTIKIGRRGSLHATLTILGIQGHVGYPHLAENSIHKAVPVLEKLINAKWDAGDKFFDPATFQITSIHAGVAENVVPGELKVSFNIRFGACVSVDKLKSIAQAICSAETGLKYNLEFKVGAEPFVTSPGKFTEQVSQLVRNATGIQPQLSTSGGTSDARFIAKFCANVLEFGVRNASIHKVDEVVELAELEQLSSIYHAVLTSL